MKKIFILFLFFIFYSKTFAIIYSESAILKKEMHNFILSISYENEDLCEKIKEKYNKKFPLYYRSNCFNREKDNKYYYFISKNKIKKKLN
jgi:hypothetical protein